MNYLNYHRPDNMHLLYAELRRSEILAEVRQIHLARRATAGRRLRHRLGNLFIAIGETLSEKRREPIYSARTEQPASVTNCGC